MISLATKKASDADNLRSLPPKFEPGIFLLAVLPLPCGVLLGLSAPGFDQWYLAWVGMIPLMLFTFGCSSLKRVFFCGLFFGLGYELVYLNWVLGLHPLTWLGFNHWQSRLLAAAALAAWALHQALLIGIFACLCRLIPLSGQLIPAKSGGRWTFPAIFVVPILWVLWMTKIGNAHALCGVPWGLLQYTQYKQFFVLQSASLFGGVGIEFLIALANMSFACLIATVWGSNRLRSIACGSKRHAVVQTVLVFLSISLLFISCCFPCRAEKYSAAQSVSILQGNMNYNIYMSRHESLYPHQFPFLRLLSKCPPGLCLGTENAIPKHTYTVPAIRNFITAKSKERSLDVVLSCLSPVEDTACGAVKSGRKQHSNSAFAVSSPGSECGEVYRKRYLVPITEYTPLFYEFCKSLVNVPSQWKQQSLVSGKSAVVFKLSCGAVAPLICVECLSPELAAESVSKGGELLVTLGDPSFLHDAMVGQQMIAINILRAVENRRFVVFACNTGPSAIIDPYGRVVLQSGHGKEEVVNGRVGFNSELTPFTRWFSALGRL